MDRKKRANDAKKPSAQTSAQVSEATATLPQRIGESASGLLKELVERPSPRTVTGVLASLNSDNAKAGSSSNSTGRGESSSAFRSSSQHEQTTSDQIKSFQLNGKGGELDRTQSQVAFDDFLAGPNELGRESEIVQDGHTLSGDQQSDVSLGIAEDNLARVQERESWRMQDENEDSADQNYDGAAVVALLSDPAFTVDEEPGSTLDLENGRGEGRNCGRLQAVKGSAKPADALNPLEPLDLMPDFGAPWNPTYVPLVPQHGIYEKGHFPEPRIGDVQPWIDILDRYHDEVWGDMLPLVKEAREELKAATESQTCLQDGPAIRRLKMVLQHLGHPNSR